jgi:hypothetical protein
MEFAMGGDIADVGGIPSKQADRFEKTAPPSKKSGILFGHRFSKLEKERAMQLLEKDVLKLIKKGGTFGEIKKLRLEIDTLSHRFGIKKEARKLHQMLDGCQEIKRPTPSGGKAPIVPPRDDLPPVVPPRDDLPKTPSLKRTPPPLPPRPSKPAETSSTYPPFLLTKELKEKPQSPKFTPVTSNIEPKKYGDKTTLKGHLEEVRKKSREEKKEELKAEEKARQAELDLLKIESSKPIIGLLRTEDVFGKKIAISCEFWSAYLEKIKDSPSESDRLAKKLTGEPHTTNKRQFERRLDVLAKEFPALKQNFEAIKKEVRGGLPLTNGYEKLEEIKNECARKEAAHKAEVNTLVENLKIINEESSKLNKHFNRIKNEIISGKLTPMQGYQELNRIRNEFNKYFEASDKISHLTLPPRMKELINLEINRPAIAQIIKKTGIPWEQIESYLNINQTVFKRLGELTVYSQDFEKRNKKEFETVPEDQKFSQFVIKASS